MRPALAPYITLLTPLQKIVPAHIAPEEARLTDEHMGAGSPSAAAQRGSVGRPYRRYELRVEQGLWQRILQALGEEALPGPATKNPN